MRNQIKRKLELTNFKRQYVSLMQGQDKKSQGRDDIELGEGHGKQEGF